MARALIVGGGPRGRALTAALRDEGFVVRAVPDPDRLATVIPHLEGVSVLCWLVGAAVPDALLEYIVDTPVRGVVYEGAALPASLGERYRIRQRRIQEPHERWLAAATTAVLAVLD